MDKTQAAAVLAETTTVRARARADMHTMWFPLVLFGSLTLASAVVSWQFGNEAMGLFWAVATPAGIAATSAFYWRWESRIGLQAPAAPTVIAIGIIVLGCFGTGLLGAAINVPLLSAAGPPFAVSAGYLVFAWVARSALLALAALSLAVVDVALIVGGADADTTGTILAAVYGTTFLAIGVNELIRRPVQL